MWRGELTFHQLQEWTARAPHEVPLIGGELARGRRAAQVRQPRHAAPHRWRQQHGRQLRLREPGLGQRRDRHGQLPSRCVRRCLAWLVVEQRHVDIDLGATLDLADFGAVSRVRELTVGGPATHPGTLTGPGQMRVTGSLVWNSGTMKGSGLTVIEAGAVGQLQSGTLDGRAVRNDGHLYQSPGDRLYGRNDGVLHNHGTITLNAERCGECLYDSGLIAEEGTSPPPLLINVGLIQKTAGTGTAVVSWWSTTSARSGRRAARSTCGGRSSAPRHSRGSRSAPATPRCRTSAAAARASRSTAPRATSSKCRPTSRSAAAGSDCRSPARTTRRRLRTRRRRAPSGTDGRRATPTPSSSRPTRGAPPSPRPTAAPCRSSSAPTASSRRPTGCRRSSSRTPTARTRTRCPTSGPPPSAPTAASWRRPTATATRPRWSTTPTGVSRRSPTRPAARSTTATRTAG